MNGLRIRLAAVAFALSVLTSIPALASPITAAEAIALVKATPGLKIDTREPSPPGLPAATHPNVIVRSGSSENDGFLDAEAATEGTLSGGATALAIPLDSGGTGGIFTQLVFVRAKGATAFAFAGALDSDGHLDVSFADGAIVAHKPLYVGTDPQCCPSKYTIETYDIRNGKLHKLASKNVPAPKSTR